jgi:hypothetical protein
MLEKYKVIFGRFGAIMPQPTFASLKEAQFVANIHNGVVVDVESGEVVHKSPGFEWEKK